MPPGSKGLTAHYFFTFGVDVQLVGDRKNTKVDQRILHLDVAAAALKLVQKGSVVVFLRFDSINQIVFDDAEPRSILISCRDDRRYFIVFQSAEDNLVFRTACADLAAKSLDLERFQRSVLRKGQLLKRGKAGALFGDRYAILTPRKLFVLSSKVSVFPSNAISLQEVSPRFDDAKGTIHLDVCGKEYVFQGTDKDSSQEWFVDIARAATSKVPILAWDDAEAIRAQQEAEEAAAAAAEQAAGSLDNRGDGDWEEDEPHEEYVTEGELLSLSGMGPARSRRSRGPTHFTEPVDWEEPEDPGDHHTEQLHQPPPHALPHSSSLRQHQGLQPPHPRHSTPGSTGARGMGTPQGKSAQRHSQQRRPVPDNMNAGLAAAAEGHGAFPYGEGGPAAAAGGRGPHGGFRSAPGSFGAGSNSLNGAAARSSNRTVARSWSGNSSNSPVPARRQQQQQQRGSLAAPPAHQVFRSSSGGSWNRGSAGSSRSGSSNVGTFAAPAAPVADGSLAGSALDTIFEAGESEGVEGTSSDPSHPAAGTEGYTTGDDTAAGEDELDSGEHWQLDEQQLLIDEQQQQLEQGNEAAEAADEAELEAQELMAQQQQQQQQLAQRRQFAPPPAAPPLRLSKLRATPQQQQHLSQQLSHAAVSTTSSAVRHSQAMQQQPMKHSAGPAAIAAAAAAAASKRAALQQQQQQQQVAAAAAAAAAAAIAQQQQQAAGAFHDASGLSEVAMAAAVAAAADQQQLQHRSFAATGGFLSPKTQIDLSAVTEAVAARLITHQQQQQQQQFARQQQQHVMFADAAYHQQQQQQLSQAMGSPMAVGPSTPPAAAFANSSNSLSPTAAAAASGSTWSSTINYGSGPGALTSPGAHGSGLFLGSNPDSNDGWGRKSLAGLYSQPAGFRPQSAATAPTASTAGPGFDGSGQYVGDYRGLQGDWAAAPRASVLSPSPRASAAAATVMQAVAMHPGSHPLTAAAPGLQGYTPDQTLAAAGALYGSPAALASARPGSSGSSGSSARGGGSSRSGVVYGEYIIPSVLRVVVSCPEGQGLAAQLPAQVQLTPHQRCLALLRWAFGVYRQLPQEARTAIPSGPRRKSLKAWTAPDMPSLTRSIRTTQLVQQQKQRQQDVADQQAQQQQLVQKQQQALQDTVLKQQQQLDQLIELLAQPPGDGLNPGFGLGLNPLGTLAQQEQQLAGVDGKLLEAFTAAADPAAGRASPLPVGLKAASEALVAAATAVAAAATDSTVGSSPSNVQQAIMQRQQLLRQHHQQQQQQQVLTHQLLQALATAASSSGAQSATAVAAAAAAAAAASRLPASSIAVLLQEAAKNLQQQQPCCQTAANCHLADGVMHQCCCCQHQITAADRPVRCASRSIRAAGFLAPADGGSSSSSSSSSSPCAVEAAAALQHTPGSGAPAGTILQRSSTSSSAESAAEQTQLQAENLHPERVAVGLPPMSLSVRLKGCGDNTPAGAVEGRHGSKASAGEWHSSRQEQQQQQQVLLGVGLRPLGGHRLKGRCSFTMDNPLFQLDALQGTQCSTSPARQPLKAAVGGAVVSSSGSSANSSRRCSTVYLSPAAAETICQAAAAAASAAAAAVRSAVVTLDGEDMTTGIAAGMRPHSIQSLVGDVACGELQPADFVATVAAGRAGPLLRPNRSSSSS